MMPARNEALTRWGVVSCEAVDYDTLHAGLSELMTDEAAPAGTQSGLVERLRQAAGPLRRLVRDAVALARTGEEAHRRDDQWPHGLVDELEDLADTLEIHDVREDFAYSATVELAPPGRRLAARMSAEHRCIRHRLESLRGLTGNFSAPAGACTTWRLLYVLLTKAAFELEDRMAQEEARLYAPVLRNRTEPRGCRGAR